MESEQHTDEDYEDDFDDEDLEDHNNLILTALVELLIDKGIMTEEELQERIEKIEDRENTEESDSTELLSSP